MEQINESKIAKIDLDTFLQIEKIIKYSGFSGVILNAITSNNIYLYALSLSLVIGSKAIDFGANYTKDYQDAIKLYKEFLERYNELNKYFAFDSPISIYVLFKYLLENGYLSYGKKFAYVDKDYQDQHILQQLEIFNGEALCRHINQVFINILKTYGINSYNLGGLFMDTSSEENLKEKIKEAFISLMGGNHIISYIPFKDKDYFIDPTNDLFFTRLGSRELVSDEGNIFKIQKRFSKSAYPYLMINNPSISLREQEDIYVSTSYLIAKENNLFNEFYDNNESLYKEITQKLALIKQKRF